MSRPCSTTAPPHLGCGQRGEQEEGDDAEDPAAPDSGGEIERIADTYGLKVIYDAAHAFGVRHKGTS